MAIIQIVEFNAPSPSSANMETQVPATIPKDTIEKLKDLVGTQDGPQHMTIGTQVQSPSTVQVISEWNDTSDLATLTTNDFTKLLHTTFDTPSLTYHIPLSPPQSLFKPHGAATGHITECVLNYHPASRVTASYKSHIESEFARFYGIFDEEARGAFGLTTGWISEELEHQDLPMGEKAKCFFVFNGWDRMQDFETSTSTESFKRALPILLDLGVPVRLWHVQKIF